MRAPRGLDVVRGTDETMTFAAPEVEAWVRAVLERGEQLHEAASREADKLLEGRGPVPVVSTTAGRWVVRRYRRGGWVAAPLLGDRYLRLGLARPLHEAHVSHEARRRGIPTPRVVAGAIYPRGPFYRADLITEYVAGAVDLARMLFDEERVGRERTEVLRRVGALVARAAAAGIEHPDLNARNVLVESFPGGTSPLLLDLDRCRVRAPGVPGDAETMLSRLTRSLRKHEERSSSRLARAEWDALRAGSGATG